MRQVWIVSGLVSAFALSSCGGGGGGGYSAPASTDTPAPVVVVPIPALKDLAKFPIGMEVAAGDEERSIFKVTGQQPTINKHFNSLVAGNIMKMAYLHPGENEFFFTHADKLRDYAVQNNMQLHGHTLIWHWDSQIPTWMKNYKGDWAAMLNTHVGEICKHFAGKVVSWDVVNEALDEREPSGFRQTIFYKNVGKAYIENAFVAARKADAAAVLYYNDYNIEASQAKLDFMLAMLDDFKARGVPVDGVGFQLHLDLTQPPIEQIRKSFKAVADRGYKIRISEMDVPVNMTGAATLTDAVAQQQKARYKSIVQAYLESVPEKQRAGITFWGLVDGESWYNYIGLPFKEWPLLFNDDYSPKPAFYGVAEALAGK